MNLLELAEKIGVTGFLHCVELDRLIELAANRDVLEVGSYAGLSAWGMAISAKTITCVDTFRAASDGQGQEGSITTLEQFKVATARFNNISIIVGASADVQVPSDFDFIFLDATHTYPEVRADINRWWPKVRPGGVMALHDYGHHSYPGVMQAADEFFGRAPDGTVVVTLRSIKKDI